MISLHKIFLFLFFNLLMVFANISLKKIMNKYGKDLLETTNFRVFFNNVIFDINIYVILLSLSIAFSIVSYLLIEHNLSKVYPLIVSCNILITVLVSYLYLGETISLLNFCGIIFIIIGIMFII